MGRCWTSLWSGARTEPSLPLPRAQRTAWWLSGTGCSPVLKSNAFSCSIFREETPPRSQLPRGLWCPIVRCWGYLRQTTTLLPATPCTEHSWAQYSAMMSTMKTTMELPLHCLLLKQPCRNRRMLAPRTYSPAMPDYSDPDSACTR